MPDTATLIREEGGDFHDDDAKTVIIDAGLAIHIDITPSRQIGAVKPWDEHLPTCASMPISTQRKTLLRASSPDCDMRKTGKPRAVPGFTGLYAAGASIR